MASFVLKEGGAAIELILPQMTEGLVLNLIRKDDVAKVEVIILSPCR